MTVANAGEAASRGGPPDVAGIVSEMIGAQSDAKIETCNG